MKKILCSLSLVLIGCSHAPVRDQVVNFPYAAELLQKVQNEETRSPANTAALEAEEGKSTRRVYFTTLYHQYLTLGSYYQRGSDIEFCPQFHHDKTETDAIAVPKLSLYRSTHIEEEGKDFFPELAFSGKHSLNEYYQGIKNELLVLCEEGVSDNFYKFDNLVTHYADNQSFHHRPKAMESVLKIPVFANFYLVKMMSAHHGVDHSYPEETRFIELTQTHWFKKYVKVASSMRPSFIKNKVSKR